MSLYDDDDMVSNASPSTATGWSQGVRALQSQLQLKTKPAAVGGGGGTGRPGGGAVLTPGPRPKQAAAPSQQPQSRKNKLTVVTTEKREENSKFTGFTPAKPFSAGNDLLPLDVKMEREYDPMWPNDYEKVVATMRASKVAADLMAAAGVGAGEDSPPGEKKRRYLVASASKARERFQGMAEGGAGAVHSQGSFPGFGSRPQSLDDEERPERGGGRGSSLGGGAAIAPPPSLTAGSASPPPSLAGRAAAKPGGGLGVAAKIMARYGFKEGGGLGKSGQGMAQALQVEKTSKRGGRIIADSGPEPAATGAAIPPPASLYDSPARQGEESDEYGGGGGEYGGTDGGEFKAPQQPAARPSITDMMKQPSKVVLMKNMVGPGEVDAELEPEVKEECEGKYGEIVQVKIREVAGVAEEETVRIYLEFKRVESAIKALVDLNGRFFGGREVQASFFKLEDFNQI